MKCHYPSEDITEAALDKDPALRPSLHPALYPPLESCSREATRSLFIPGVGSLMLCDDHHHLLTARKINPLPDDLSTLVPEPGQPVILYSIAQHRWEVWRDDSRLGHSFSHVRCQQAYPRAFGPSQRQMNLAMKDGYKS